jgi:hypothetical protein
MSSAAKPAMDGPSAANDRPSDDTMRRNRANRPKSLRHLRDARWLRLLAVVVMVFQVALATDHLGATAARAAVAADETAGSGILAMCHPVDAGELSAADFDDDDRPIDPGADRCPLCTSPAVAGSLLAPAPPAAPLLDAPVGDRIVLPPVVALPVAAPLRYGVVRGPPTSIRL